MASQRDKRWVVPPIPPMPIQEPRCIAIWVAMGGSAGGLGGATPHGYPDSYDALVLGYARGV